ncbi:MAG TPA: CHASE3 domain-containing protein [Puia sp.]|nr:CHASE3 domain-containing protein [Puia sp.]
MRLKFSEKIRNGYLVAFLLLLFSYIFTIAAVLQLKKQNQWVNHTREVINKLELVASYLKDSEIGLRGLIMMKDEKFLLPYYPSKHKVDSIYNDLHQSIADNSIETERVLVLKNLLDKKFALINLQLDTLRDSHLEVNDFIRTTAYESKKLMDSIRNIIGFMENHENDLLNKRTAEVSSSNQGLYIIIAASLLISVLLLGYSIFTYIVENMAKRKATLQAEDYHVQLEKRIIELNVANDELVELRSMEKFASTGRIARVIAHEIRNPLTNINLSADQLSFDGVTEEDKKYFLDVIQRNSIRINYLITDLLNATKFSELNYEVADVNLLLDESLQFAADRAQFNKITIEKKYGYNIPAVKVDGERIKIAFLNIIVNAIESMDGTMGKLVLETTMKNNICFINISDNGKGMNKETLSKIFDPYFTSKRDGNGLGLTNTQNIILNHKGKIQVNSELNKGTTFTILLNI